MRLTVLRKGRSVLVTLVTRVHVRDIAAHGAVVKSAWRVVEILDLLGEEPQGLTISEISRRLGIARSSAHGLVQTLLRSGYIHTDGGDRKRFRLGVRLIQLGLNVADSLDVRSVARPHLERLVARTHETAFLALPLGGELVYVDKIVSDVREVRTDLRLGARRPLHCTSLGKALLAAISDASVREAVKELGMRRATSSSIDSASALVTDLQATRDRGYSIDRHEAVVGVCCVGAPIRDHLGKPRAAISVSTIDQLFRPEELGPEVLEAALAVSHSLGWMGDAKTLYESTEGSFFELFGPSEPERERRFNDNDPS